MTQNFGPFLDLHVNVVMVLHTVVCVLRASQLQQTLKRFKGLTSSSSSHPLLWNCVLLESQAVSMNSALRETAWDNPASQTATLLYSWKVTAAWQLLIPLSLHWVEHLILIVSSILFWLFSFAVLCATEDTSHYSSWVPKNAGSVVSFYTIGPLSKKVVETTIQGQTSLSGITLPIPRATENISTKFQRRPTHALQDGTTDSLMIPNDSICQRPLTPQYSLKEAG